MNRLLGVLPLHQSIVVAGAGARKLTEEDVDAWASKPGQTPVNFAGATGRNPRLAGYCDQATINGGKLYVYGDLDPALPGGADARWGVKDSGVFDRLNALVLARPDPLRDLTKAERELMVRHWGGWPQGDAGVLIASVSVSAIGIAPGAAWLGA